MNKTIQHCKLGLEYPLLQFNPFHQFQLKPAIILPNFQRLALFLSQSYFHYGPFAFISRPHGLSITFLLFLWFASSVLIRKAMESLGFSAEDLVHCQILTIRLRTSVPSAPKYIFPSSSHRNTF
jgi:hypothetical protein